MRLLVILVIFYNAQNYDPQLYEIDPPREYGVTEILGDGYSEIQKEEKQKEEIELIEYLVMQRWCDPFCT